MAVKKSGFDRSAENAGVMPSMKKLWLKILLLIIALGVVAYVTTKMLRPTPIRVETAVVQTGALQVTIDAEGKTRVHDRFVVAAPITGQLSRINFHRGDLLQQNQVIAQIRPLPMAPLDPRQLAEVQARVTTAEQLKNEADTIVEHARADCEQTRREFERTEKLVESGDIPRQEFERARTASQTCRQQIEAAQFKARAAASEVNVAKAALIVVERAGQSGNSAVVSVRAPVRGRVTKLLEESERVVMAGTPLIELSNHALEIVIDVLSSDAVKIKPGATIFIEGNGEEQPSQARVRLIEPSAFTKISALGIEEQRVNVIADFIGDTGSLGDGYRVETRIVIWENPQVIKALSSALFRDGEKWNVFVVENGIAKRREIEIGHRTSLEVEILRGLQAGTNVVVHPSNQLADGVQVEVNHAKK